MKIAIAGSGDLARYQMEELLNKSYDVVILARRDKEWFNSKKGVEVRVIDFHSIDSIYFSIKDCHGLVSSIEDASSDFKKIHSNLIDAMLKTDICRRFIPSEYIGDSISFPDQPMFYNDTRVPVRNKLRKLPKGDLEWTLLNGGWLSDYFADLNRRYIKDIHPLHPINRQKGTSIIPGTGDESISFTSARDLAKAASELFASDEPWEEVTFVSGEHSSWNRAIKENLPSINVEHHSLAMIVEDFLKAFTEKDEEKVALAQFQLWSASGACAVPRDVAEKHKQKYFKNIHFRSISEFIEDSLINSDSIL